MVLAPELPMKMPPDEIMGLPVDLLALRILELEASNGQGPNRHNFLTSADQSYPKAANHREVVQALAEGYDWLLQQGLVSTRVGHESWMFITRKGHQVLNAPDGIGLIRAEARLNVDLHPRIASRIRSQFLLGEYELAAFAAMREVEIRVRELAGAHPRDIGVDLMKKAFKVGEGPLADASAVKGEQEAMMALFWGAIGVFKNPPSHRQVDYDEPTLASGVVLFADLLLRLLDVRAPASG